MEVVSGVASITQLVAYGHAAGQVLSKLYQELRDAPVIWHNQQTNIQHLLNTVRRISKSNLPVSHDTIEHILVLVFELSAIAHKALSLVLTAKKPGFLGVCWSYLGTTDTLNRAFESLKDKRQLLHLLLSEALLVTSIKIPNTVTADRPSKAVANNMPKETNPPFNKSTKQLPLEQEHNTKENDDSEPGLRDNSASTTSPVKFGDITAGDHSSVRAGTSWGRAVVSQGGRRIEGGTLTVGTGAAISAYTFDEDLEAFKIQMEAFREQTKAFNKLSLSRTRLSPSDGQSSKQSPYKTDR